jgi:plasmid stabilization system protein ParE
MQDKIYKLRYLPLFEQDLLDTVNYISKVLKNEEAAMRLINDVETAILVRLNNPVAFEPYHSRKKREYPYYRIYVRNYVIYYVVIDDVLKAINNGRKSKTPAEITRKVKDLKGTVVYFYDPKKKENDEKFWTVVKY